MIKRSLSELYGHDPELDAALERLKGDDPDADPLFVEFEATGERDREAEPALDATARAGIDSERVPAGSVPGESAGSLAQWLAEPLRRAEARRSSLPPAPDHASEQGSAAGNASDDRG